MGDRAPLKTCCLITGIGKLFLSHFCCFFSAAWRWSSFALRSAANTTTNVCTLVTHPHLHLKGHLDVRFVRCDLKLRFGRRLAYPGSRKCTNVNMRMCCVLRGQDKKRTAASHFKIAHVNELSRLPSSCRRLIKFGPTQLRE